MAYGDCIAGGRQLEGGTGRPFALWNTRTYATPQAARASGAFYRRLGATAASLRGLFASGLFPPHDVRLRYDPAGNDLRLARGSPAIDKGVVLPNFSDGFTGQAPDLGCCEFGQPLPQYGPRPRTVR